MMVIKWTVIMCSVRVWTADSCLMMKSNDVFFRTQLPLGFHAQRRTICSIVMLQN